MQNISLFLSFILHYLNQFYVRFIDIVNYGLILIWNFKETAKITIIISFYLFAGLSLLQSRMHLFNRLGASSKMTWLLVVLCLGFTCSSPIEMDWSEDNNNFENENFVPSSLGHLRNDLKTNKDALLDSSSSEDNARYDINDMPMHRVRRIPLSILMKRALSLFTQWHPMPSGGSQRYLTPGNDFVSAVTRDNSRPRGQPLRWG